MATVAAPNGQRWAEGMDEDEKYAFDTGGYGGSARLRSALALTQAAARGALSTVVPRLPTTVDRAAGSCSPRTNVLCLGFL